MVRTDWKQLEDDYREVQNPSEPWRCRLQAWRPGQRTYLFLRTLPWILFRWKKGIWLFGHQKKCPGRTAAVFGTGSLYTALAFLGVTSQIKTATTCSPQRCLMQCNAEYSNSLKWQEHQKPSAAASGCSEHKKGRYQDFFFFLNFQIPALKRETRPQKSDFSELTTWMVFDTKCLQHRPGTVSRERGAVASLEMGYGCPWRAIKERAVSTDGARSDSQACSNLIEGNRWPQSAFNKFIQHLLNTAALLLHIFFSTDLEIITLI